MPVLTALRTMCFSDNGQEAKQRVTQQIALWEAWCHPIHTDNPIGEDPNYDDDFERIKEQVNKLSGANTQLISQLAQKLLTTVCKDIRVITYYIWAKLHQEGEAGFAQSLGLLAALMIRYQATLLPMRPHSRKVALEWLTGQRVLDSLSLHPEVDSQHFSTIVALLGFIIEQCETWDEQYRPNLMPLLHALEQRLAQFGGADSVLSPNNPSVAETAHYLPSNSTIDPLSPIQSTRELLDQAKILARFLSNQPLGWLSAHRVIKAIRWDTLHQSPPQNQQSCTRLAPPRSEAKAQLKRLYLQQNWLALAEQANNLFAEGVNHFWLDVQWYLHQALRQSPSPWDSWAEIIATDLQQFLTRLPGLETLCWEDGTPFADDVTLIWIKQHILPDTIAELQNYPTSQTLPADEDAIFALEQEALNQADNQGIETALGWLINRPEMTHPRQKWLLKLVMARIAEQFSRHDLAFNLLVELDNQANLIRLADWEPAYLFEIKARQLQLLRNRVQRNSLDKEKLHLQMVDLLAELTRLDPLRALVLYP